MLHSACSNGQYSTVQQLLANQKNKKSTKVEVNERDDRGWTPLLHVACSGHLAIVRELLQNGADVTMASSSSGSTPLHLLARVPAVGATCWGRGNSEQKGEQATTPHLPPSLAFLSSLRQNSHTYSQSFHDAISHHMKAMNDQEALHFRLALFVAEEEDVQVSVLRSLGSTALQLFEVPAAALLDLASLLTNVDEQYCLILWLLYLSSGKDVVARRAFVNATDANGETPLHWAAQAGNALAVRILLSLGASVNCVSMRLRWDPLQFAAKSGDFQTVLQVLQVVLAVKRCESESSSVDLGHTSSRHSPSGIENELINRRLVVLENARRIAVQFNKRPAAFLLVCAQMVAKPYFHGVLSREETMRRLQPNTFLLRFSASSSQFILSSLQITGANDPNSREDHAVVRLSWTGSDEFFRGGHDTLLDGICTPFPAAPQGDGSHSNFPMVIAQFARDEGNWSEEERETMEGGIEEWVGKVTELHLNTQKAQAQQGQQKQQGQQVQKQSQQGQQEIIHLSPSAMQTGNLSHPQYSLAPSRNHRGYALAPARSPVASRAPVGSPNAASRSLARSPAASRPSTARPPTSRPPARSRPPTRSPYVTSSAAKRPLAYFRPAPQQPWTRGYTKTRSPSSVAGSTAPKTVSTAIAFDQLQHPTQTTQTTQTTSLPPPPLLSSPFYHGAIARPEACRRLQGLPAGAFLIRQGRGGGFAREGGFAISVRDDQVVEGKSGDRGDGVAHIQMMYEDRGGNGKGGGKWMVQGVETAFLSLEDLVAASAEFTEPLTVETFVDREMSQYAHFHGKINAQEAERRVLEVKESRKGGGVGGVHLFRISPSEDLLIVTELSSNNAVVHTRIRYDHSSGRFVMVLANKTSCYFDSLASVVDAFKGRLRCERGGRREKLVGSKGVGGSQRKEDDHRNVVKKIVNAREPALPTHSSMDALLPFVHNPSRSPKAIDSNMAISKSKATSTSLSSSSSSSGSRTRSLSAGSANELENVNAEMVNSDSSLCYVPQLTLEQAEALLNSDKMQYGDCVVTRLSPSSFPPSSSSPPSSTFVVSIFRRLGSIGHLTVQREELRGGTDARWHVCEVDGCVVKEASSDSKTYPLLSSSSSSSLTEMLAKYLRLDSGGQVRELDPARTQTVSKRCVSLFRLMPQRLPAPQYHRIDLKRVSQMDNRISVRGYGYGGDNDGDTVSNSFRARYGRAPGGVGVYNDLKLSNGGGNRLYGYGRSPGRRGVYDSPF